MRTRCTMAALATALMLACAPAAAQRGVVAGSPTRAPAGNPSATTFGLPSPSGLTSRFPAGLPDTTPFPAGLPPVTPPNVASPGVAPGSPAIDAGIATNRTGTAGTYLRPVYVAPPTMHPPPYTALEIAQSFLAADLDQDGELTREEAQRLPLVAGTFDDMDANHDGVITRFEYESAMGR